MSHDSRNSHHWMTIFKMDFYVLGRSGLQRFQASTRLDSLFPAIWSGIHQVVQNREKHIFCRKPNLDNARKLRFIFPSIPKMESTQDELEVLVSAMMPLQRSNGIQITKFACIVEAHNCTGNRWECTLPQNHEGRIVEEFNSMSLYYLVHKSYDTSSDQHSGFKKRKGHLSSDARTSRGLEGHCNWRPWSVFAVSNWAKVRRHPNDRCKSIACYCEIWLDKPLTQYHLIRRTLQCCWKFQSQSVQTFGFIHLPLDKRSKSRSGIKDQWFLLNELCPHMLTSFGKSSARMVCFDVVWKFKSNDRSCRYFAWYQNALKKAK